MKPPSKGKRWLAAASATVAVSAVAAAAAGVFAAPAALGSARAASSTPLIMESSQETTLTDNFNPFVSTGAAATLGATSMIYETPLQFDLVRPLQKPYDFLASSYKWGPGGKSITLTIRSGINWMASNKVVRVTLTISLEPARTPIFSRKVGRNDGALTLTL